MRHVHIALALTACSGLALTCLASPLDRSLAPDSTAILIHADIDAARASSLGKHILDNRSAYNLQGLDALKAFGIDAVNDLASVTVVATAKQPDKGVLIIKSSPSIDALWTHLKTEPHAKPMSVAGHDILSWDDKGVRKYGVVRNAPAAAGSALPANQQRHVFICDDWEQLAVVLSHASAAKPASSTAQPGDRAPAPNSVLFVRLREVPANMATPGDFGAQAIFGSMTAGTLDIADASGSISAAASIQFDAPEAAADMRVVSDGLAAFLRMGARKMAESAPFAEALASVKSAVEGRSLTLNATWTLEQAKSLLQAVIAADKNKADAKSE